MLTGFTEVVALAGLNSVSNIVNILKNTLENTSFFLLFWPLVHFPGPQL